MRVSARVIWVGNHIAVRSFRSCGQRAVGLHERDTATVWWPNLGSIPFSRADHGDIIEERIIVAHVWCEAKAGFSIDANITRWNIKKESWVNDPFDERLCWWTDRFMVVFLIGTQRQTDRFG